MSQHPNGNTQPTSASDAGTGRNMYHSRYNLPIWVYISFPIIAALLLSALTATVFYWEQMRKYYRRKILNSRPYPWFVNIRARVLSWIPSTKTKERLRKLLNMRRPVTTDDISPPVPSALLQGAESPTPGRPQRPLSITPSVLQQMRTSPHNLPASGEEIPLENLERTTRPHPHPAASQRSLSEYSSQHEEAPHSPTSEASFDFASKRAERFLARAKVRRELEKKGGATKAGEKSE